jgi:hypothetical protein
MRRSALFIHLIRFILVFYCMFYLYLLRHFLCSLLRIKTCARICKYIQSLTSVHEVWPYIESGYINQHFSPQAHMIPLPTQNKAPVLPNHFSQPIGGYKAPGKPIHLALKPSAGESSLKIVEPFQNDFKNGFRAFFNFR